MAAGPESAAAAAPARRAACGRCGRPARGACEVCAALPAGAPLGLRPGGGFALVLRHPRERRRALGTGRLLLAALSRCALVHGRKFHGALKGGRCNGGSPASGAGVGDDDPRAEALLRAAVRGAQAGRWPLLLLHPAGQEAAAALEEWRRERDLGGGGAGAGVEEGGESDRVWGPGGAPAYVLVAIDGTWQEAKEMVKALPEEILAVARRVSFEIGPGGASAPLRTEPAPGCTSTLEAVARALGALEGDAALRDALLAPLERLVDIQARYDPAVRQRLCGGSGAGIATSRRAGPGIGGG